MNIKIFLPFFLFFYSITYAQINSNTITDVDGNVYTTVTIGDQEWMTENLRTTRFNDGIDILNIIDEKEWVQTNLPAYSWYENNSSNKSVFGGLYNWYAVHSGKLCPEGWRIPRDKDWEKLVNYYGGINIAAKEMDGSGFKVTLGGYRYGYYWGSGLFREQGINGYWWTITNASDTHVWARTISDEKSKMYRSYFEKNNGFSVRCLKCKSRTVHDIDGNDYQTVIIGDQEWMTENLKVIRYNDGSPIPNVTDVTEWHNCNTPAYVWYDNDISHKDIYGALYNGYVLENSDKLCPPGWRVASDDDWKELEMYMGMTREQADGTVWRGTNEGGKLKETGTGKWATPNKGAVNAGGLSIVPGGRRDSGGRFYDQSTGSTIWTSSVTSISSACYRHFSNTNKMIGRNLQGDKKFGFAVRCINDRLSKVDD